MLKNKVAVITGASRGIGRGIAERLAQEEMNLILIGSSDEIHNTAEKIKAIAKRQITSIRVDVTNEEEVQQAFSNVFNQFSGIDLLVNNAGVGFFKLVEETTAAEWRKIFDVNVHGMFFCTKAVLPHMKKKQSGTIINISSDVGRRTIADGSAYTATKYAVQGFTGSLSQEVRKFGIRVGTINPGMVDTYFANSEQGLPEKQDWMKVQDIANAVLYMASAPSYMVIDEIVLHPLIQDYPLP